MQVFRNVETKVGDWTTRLNFVLTDQSEAVLNFDFLRNTVFVLDYDRREIRSYNERFPVGNLFFCERCAHGRCLPCCILSYSMENSCLLHDNME